MRASARPTRIRCQIGLPAHFRRSDVQEFHGRDRQSLAERVEADGLRKGIVWHGYTACLTLQFTADSVLVELALDASESAANPEELEALVTRMLGLAQPVEAFEARHRGHPRLGPLLARQRGLRVPLAASPFEALTWAVTGQQVSLAAAVVLRRKMILAAGLRHSSGLACYPDAARIAALPPGELRQAGYSQAKAATMITLGQLAAAQALPLEDWLAALPAVEEVRTRLLAVRGVGPWTVDYALLRGFGWIDGSLHKDAGVRRGLQRLLQCADRITEAETREWLAQFSPWRALVAAHLWAANAVAEER